MGVSILRLQEGLDYSKIFAKESEVSGEANGPSTTWVRQNSRESLPRNTSYSQMSQGTFISH
jgi:hypothetical protein